jgi:hypothetical protein
MQYVFSMTSRMVTIALGCALLLGVLLFLLGMQIGARLTADTPAQQPMTSASWAAAVEPARARAVAAPTPGSAQAQAPAQAAAPAPAPATAGAANASNTDASSDSSDTADGADVTAAQPAAVVPVVVPATADSGS